MELTQLGSLLGSVIAPLAGAVAAYVAIRQDLAVLRTRVDAGSQNGEILADRVVGGDGARNRG